jgi:hypothetical protein
MAKSLNSFIYELREIINQSNLDFIGDNRLLADFIINKRVKWFENTYNKFNKTIPQSYYQTIGCLKVIPTDISECNCDLSDCYVLRTEQKIPDFISLSDTELIHSVKPISVLARPFTLIQYNRVPYWGNSRYNTGALAAFYYNGYMYFIGSNPTAIGLIDSVSIRGVFRDPRDLASVSNCDNKPCFSSDDIFPLEERLWEYCKADILQNELNMKISTPEDLQNNNRQDTVGNANI